MISAEDCSCFFKSGWWQHSTAAIREKGVTYSRPNEIDGLGEKERHIRGMLGRTSFWQEMKGIVYT
jgi:hypothetical protein